MRLHDGYASISPVTDQSEHSIQISIEQILISIERSARYELVLVPVDGHTVLGYRTSAAVAERGSDWKGRAGDANVGCR